MFRTNVLHLTLSLRDVSNTQCLKKCGCGFAECGKMVELGRLAVWCLVSIGTFSSSDATLKTTAPHFREDTVPLEKGLSLRGFATFNSSIVRCGPF